MQTKAQYITENAKYIEDDSLAALESCPDMAWLAVCAACRELTDSDDPGVSCEVAVTKETIADFIKSRCDWATPGRRKEFSAEGLNAVMFTDFQITKGQRRSKMAVVDAGECRVCLTY